MNQQFRIPDITVNSLIVERRNASNGNHTYIGRISFITSEGRCLVIDTRWISFNGTRHTWNSNVTIEARKCQTMMMMMMMMIIIIIIIIIIINITITMMMIINSTMILMMTMVVVMMMTRSQ